MNNRDKYEVVIGLEIHAQMLTKSKAYASDANEFGSHPNTNVSVVSLGHPGTLPVMNKKTIENAIKLGLACHANIASDQYFARKNYFYPDLPKGYQITQDKTPICTGGYLVVKDDQGIYKNVGITRIHMEEDAGKSIHDVDVYDTLVDLNRAGVPLLEIVSEPDIRSSQEAYNYVTEVRKLVRYLDICDGNMEEGSLRCDANISVRLIGAKEFGTKVEVKNMNSIRNVQRAIEFEISRQIEVVETGGTVSQETRGFDALKGITISMRSKEAANDYRYFPEPDLQPIFVGQEHIEAIKLELPALPRELYLKYTEQFGLSEYDASILVDNKHIALYFEDILKNTTHIKMAANFLMGEIKGYLNQRVLEITEFPLKPAFIADLINLIEAGKVSYSVASSKIFPAMFDNQTLTALELATKLNVLQESDENSLVNYINQVIEGNPAEIQRYINGEKQLVGFLMGQLMKISQGKADPKQANPLLRKVLDSLS
ncbi:MAG: Asp-tRNA(Asn)/Glu-tRNA(Gln) amidotransferase subunit GatB [Crocinitomicaceae bacterium]|nr:Asp-tRNA(Asn)/Glu-tRNA(Gln) amidotransferase subunit GatB [Crocinitomicaceae bacterium]